MGGDAIKQVLLYSCPVAVRNVHICKLHQLPSDPISCLHTAQGYFFSLFYFPWVLFPSFLPNSKLHSSSLSQEGCFNTHPDIKIAALLLFLPGEWMSPEISIKHLKNLISMEQWGQVMTGNGFWASCIGRNNSRPRNEHFSQLSRLKRKQAQI